MNDSTCPRPCLMKLDLQSSTNKLAFLKDNWPSFRPIIGNRITMYPLPAGCGAGCFG